MTNPSPKKRPDEVTARRAAMFAEMAKPLSAVDLLVLEVNTAEEAIRTIGRRNRAILARLNNKFRSRP